MHDIFTASIAFPNDACISGNGGSVYGIERRFCATDCQREVYFVPAAIHCLKYLPASPWIPT